MSFRIVKGVYYRVGASSGEAIDYTVNVSKGSGKLAVTNKHIYFSGDRAVKIALVKIVAMKAYSDGITISVQSGVNTKDFTFIVDSRDVWFLHNLLANIPD